jgi:phenylalanyl-tRNA synthetase beta chain
MWRTQCARGLRTAVALIGAELPGNIKIIKTRIRDIVSSGMLCSSAELGIDDDASGILELDAKAPKGAFLNDHLGYPDNVFDIELTPNRGDCLSMAGIAREASVLFGSSLSGPRLKPVKPVSARPDSASA